MFWRVEKAQKVQRDFINPPQYKNAKLVESGLAYSDAAALTRELRDQEPKYTQTIYRMVPDERHETP